MSKDRSILREVVRPQPEMEVRAVGTVLHHATDAADAAELLDMLGLIKPSERLQQDQECPSRALRQRLRERRSAKEYGASTAKRGSRG